MALRRQRSGRARRPKVVLHSPGWTRSVRAGLQNLISAGAGKGLPVVFDFDNTIVCGDIGEATLAILVRSGLVTPAKVPNTLSPAFRLDTHRRVTPENSADLTEYYDAFLAPTVHGGKDPAPLGNGYVWAVEVMTGLSPWQVVHAAREAFELGKAATPQMIEVTPGRTAFPAPVFYEEMIELIGLLLTHGFEVWIVSASNVWSVRWLVLKELNPRLRALGCQRQVPAHQVIGISTLLADGKDYLHKDPILVSENSGYAALEPRVLQRFRLTSRLHFPVPTYSGKVASIVDNLPCRPWLCVGDSPGDHAMMAWSQHQLWLARLDKPAYQQAAMNVRRAGGNDSWLIQPLIPSRRPAFLADSVQSLERSEQSVAVRRSLACLKG